MLISIFGAALILLIVLLCLQMFKACLISATGLILSLLVMVFFLLAQHNPTKNKPIVLLINYLRFVILILACVIPAVMWNYLPGYRDTVSVFFALIGAIVSFLVYVAVILDTFISDMRDCNKERTEK